MPSLFERVGRSLTRKKPELFTTNKNDSGLTALDSGFEQVSPADTKGYVSPPEAKSPTEKSGGVFQTFLRSKSPSRADPARYDRAPHLSLHLPDLSEGGSSIREKLTIVFEQPVDPRFSDDVLAAKRLTTAETLSLVQKTASVITQRGLETPGIFKSFWYAQSQHQQRKLLVSFLQTLSGNSGTSTDPEKDANRSIAQEAFDAHLASASPHDVAEVFKWAIRHFQLEGASFGNSKAEYGWYQQFAEAERAANFPPEAYTTILAPLLPPQNLDLLNAIFNFGSSVASYAEINGVSGSKLTRTIGWWLLSERQQSSNGLVGFIQDWDTAARILEHLFLAYVRDQQRQGLMPKRLTQLVKSYPYLKQAAPMDQYFLPRPKFSTQQRSVLFLRVAVAPNAKDAYARRPLQLLRDAIGAQVDEASGNAEYHSIWEEIKRQTLENVTAPNSPTSPVEGTSLAPIVSVSGLLTETSLRTLNTASGESTLTSPIKPSQSVLQTPMLSPSRRTTDGGFSTTNSTALTSPVDWDDFTGSGFGTLSTETSLTFSDFGPPPSKQGSATLPANARSTTSRSKQSMRSTRRKSVDFKRPSSPTGNGQPSTPSAEKDAKELHAKDASAIQSESMEGTLDLDEAFIDGWAEILLDKTVGGPWPSFALYELRTPLTQPSAATAAEGDDAEAVPTRIHWLAIETYIYRAPVEEEMSVPSSPVKATGGKVKRSSSQRSERRNRFGFFSSTTSLNKEEKRKDHVRRASEISTDSATKAKDPSKSQVDVSAPPEAIAEEPEPTTPIPPIAEEAAKDVPIATGVPEEVTKPETDVAAPEEVAVKEEVAPAPATLTLPATEGSRFVEGSSPGTIPETVTDAGDDHDLDRTRHDSKSVDTDAVAAVTSGTVALGVAELAKHKEEEPTSAPDSETQIETAVPHVEEEPTKADGVPATTPPPADEIAVGSQPAADAIESARVDVEGDGDEAEAEAESIAQKLRDEQESERLRIVQEAEEKAAQEAAETARLKQEQEESKARLAAEEEIRRLQAEEDERLKREQEFEAQKAAAAELERQHIAKEAEEKAAQEAAERARLKQEQEELEVRLAAEELEKQRLAREEESRRLQAEEDERLKREQELEAQKAAAAELERQRIVQEAEEERLAAEELERQRQLAKEEEIRLAREEENRLAREEEIRRAEEERLAAIEQERLKREQELEAQKAAAELERQQQLAKEQEAAELAKQQAEELERLAREEEIRRAEEARLAKEEEERLRLQAEEDERLKREQELEAAREAELAKERERELARQREEEIRLAEENRLIAEKEAEERRLRLEEEEKKRKAEEDEQRRLEEEKLEEQRRQEAMMLAAKEEETRLAEEKLARELAAREAELEEERIAREKADAEAAAEKQRLEKEAEEKRIADELAERARLEEEELERQRLAAEEAEHQQLKEEEERARAEAEELKRQRIAEEERAKAEAEQERARLEAEAAEKAEKERQEQERLLAEQRQREEQEKLAHEEEEREALKRKQEEEEQERAAFEEVEKKRAEEEEQARLEAEHARLEEERQQQEREAAVPPSNEASESKESSDPHAETSEAKAIVEETQDENPRSGVLEHPTESSERKEVDEELHEEGSELPDEHHDSSTHDEPTQAIKEKDLAEIEHEDPSAADGEPTTEEPAKEEEDIVKQGVQHVPAGEEGAPVHHEPTEDDEEEIIIGGVHHGSAGENW